MQVLSSHQSLQNFVWAISYGRFEEIDITSVEGQEQALDHLIHLLHYCERYGTNIPKGLQIFPEFFAIPYVENFFTLLFANLDDNLFCKAESVFIRGLEFTVDYLGLPKSQEIVRLLLENLQKRFPALKEMYNKAFEHFINEFFRPTVGDFIKAHKNSVDLFEVDYPFLFSLFINPLKKPQFANRKLYIFFCNPWIYQPILRYLAYNECHFSPEINCHVPEIPIKWLEKRLQIVHSQTSCDSWQELKNKALEALNHSKQLEPFSIELAGLMGEIKAAAQFIKNFCVYEDIVTFLPKIKHESSCDLMVKHLKANCYDLIESKAKTPRHGLDEKTAGESQIWDDFFNNYSHAINSYLIYLYKTIQPPLGINKSFPLFQGFEGSDYATALSLIENIPLTKSAIPLKNWTSEQKLNHLFNALFLQPMILKTFCVQLPTDEERLMHRQQITKDALQKGWVENLLKNATEQLEITYQRQRAKGYHISKMYVALDFDLSYRLLHDPLSYDDGNIRELVAQTLHEAFEPFRKSFAAKGLDLNLLIIQP